MDDAEQLAGLRGHPARTHHGRCGLRASLTHEVTHDVRPFGVTAFSRRCVRLLRVRRGRLVPSRRTSRKFAHRYLELDCSVWAVALNAEGRPVGTFGQRFDELAVPEKQGGVLIDRVPVAE